MVVETRSGAVVDEPYTEGKPSKEVTEPTITRGITARAGGARVRAHRGWMGLDTVQAYTLLALGHLSLAVPLIFGWKQTAKAAFGKAADPPEDQHGHLLNLYASTLCSSAAIAFSLEELARRRLLHSYTADVLKLGLIGHGLAWFALFLYYPATLTFFAMMVEGAGSLATMLLPASELMANSNDRARVWRDIKSIGNKLPGFVPTRRRGRFSWLSSMYAVLTLMLPVAGFAYFVAPRTTLFHTFGYDYGRSSHLMWKAVGAGGLMTIMPSLLLALKHKADINMMAATPARTLNLGLMGTAVGHLLVLGPIAAKGHGGVMMPFILGTWGMTLLTSMLGLAAPEVTELVEQVTEQAKTQ